MDQQLKRRRFWPNPDSPGPLPLMPDESEDILVISTPAPGARHFGEIIEGLLANQPWPRRILISSYGEPADYDFLEVLSSVAKHLGILDRIAVFDAGRHCSGFRDIKTIIYSPWWFDRTINLFDYDLDGTGMHPIPFDQRTYTFSCLNRIARSHRVKLVERIIDEGLLTEGLVTCGPATPTYMFDRWCRPETLKYFPLDPLGDLEEMTGDPRNVVFDASKPNQQLMSSIINLISETSYERLTDIKESWERGMTTEKTVKTYMSHQLPLWLATHSFVDYQRGMGFDLFDDLIDHSYDNIMSPWERIDAVVRELKRLCAIPRKELVDFCVQNQHRFEFNRQWARQKNQEMWQEAATDFKNWLA